MASADKSVCEQEDCIRSIERTIENFKKISQKNFTPAIARSRLSILEKLWERCQQLHAEITASVPTAERASHSYLKGDRLSKAEDAYLEATDYLTETLDKLLKAIGITTPNVSHSVISECHANSSMQLLTY